jgi:VIT1/CCC1 family predicted Fe2+/Mn2+ transporter
VTEPLSTASAADAAAVAEPPLAKQHHRDIQGGAARAAIFGVSDGLVSNVSLILGVAGAAPAAGVVRLAGLAGLIAGSVSMAAGEYVSMKAQAELLEHELDMERIELRRNPHDETAELAEIYTSRGIGPDQARHLAEQVMKDPEQALEVHAREELGIDPSSLGSPVMAAVTSFLAFAVGALLPLVPWFFTHGAAAEIGSVLLGVTGAIAVGTALARFTGRSMVRSAFRQLLIAVVAAGVTWAVGRVVGINV